MISRAYFIHQTSFPLCNRHYVRPFRKYSTTAANAAPRPPTHIPTGAKVPRAYIFGHHPPLKQMQRRIVRSLHALSPLCIRRQWAQRRRFPTRRKVITAFSRRTTGRQWPRPLTQPAPPRPIVQLVVYPCWDKDVVSNMFHLAYITVGVRPKTNAYSDSFYRRDTAYQSVTHESDRCSHNRYLLTF